LAAVSEEYHECVGRGTLLALPSPYWSSSLEFFGMGKQEVTCQEDKTEYEEVFQKNVIPHPTLPLHICGATSLV
jgi:hypothetical protein